MHYTDCQSKINYERLFIAIIIKSLSIWILLNSILYRFFVALLYGCPTIFLEVPCLYLELPKYNKFLVDICSSLSYVSLKNRLSY